MPKNTPSEITSTQCVIFQVLYRIKIFPSSQNEKINSPYLFSKPLHVSIYRITETRHFTKNGPVHSQKLKYLYQSHKFWSKCAKLRILQMVLLY